MSTYKLSIVGFSLSKRFVDIYQEDYYRSFFDFNKDSAKDEIGANYEEEEIILADSDQSARAPFAIRIQELDTQHQALVAEREKAAHWYEIKLIRCDPVIPDSTNWTRTQEVEIESHNFYGDEEFKNR